MKADPCGSGSTALIKRMQKQSLLSFLYFWRLRTIIFFLLKLCFRVMNSIEPNPDSYATQNSEIHIPVAKLLQHWPQVDVGSNRQGPAAVPAWCTKIFVSVALKLAGLWIRIHFMRIQIQLFFWMRNRIQLNQIWRKNHEEFFKLKKHKTLLKIKKQWSLLKFTLKKRN